MLDIIIKGGEVIDGKGGDSFQADIGILNDRITKIGRLSSSEGKRIIDAGNLAVCPGFIDMHSHESTILFDPPPESKIRQGITTEVMGNCGLSFAPISGKGIEKARESLSVFKDYTDEITWSSMREYLSVLERKGLITNCIQLTGQGTIRASVVGLEDRTPNPEELEEMKALVKRSMEEGSWGLSTGLIYPPGVYAHTGEIIELAKEAASFKGIYATHMRGEHEGALEKSLEEAMRIGREARLPVQISHFKLYGEQLQGKADYFIKKIEKAAEQGLNIAADAYPYIATHTTLKTILPSWAQDGGVSLMVKRLKDESLCRRMKEDMGAGNVIYFKGVSWSSVKIVKSNKHEFMDGKSIAEIAEIKSIDPYDLVFDILAEEPGMRANYFALDERDVMKILKHPLVMIGSDSYALSTKGDLAQGKPHPRAFGTFPRILGRYVRKEKLFTLAEAVRKISAFAAQRLGLKDRGRVEEGAFADIVLFDPDRVIDRADFSKPQQYPEGIECVLLNGEVAVESGEYTGKIAGRVLRRF